MRHGMVLLAVLVVVGLALWGMGAVLAAPGGPEAEAGTVQGTALLTLYDDTFITTTTTYPDAQRVRYYNSFDLFVTADFSTTGAITVTPQFSADGINWVDGFYTAEGWVLPLAYSATLTNTSDVTNTETSVTLATAFSGATATRASADVAYEIALSADGGTYLRNIPVVGFWLRPKIEASGAVTDGVELLIQAVARNN